MSIKTRVLCLSLTLLAFGAFTSQAFACPDQPAVKVQLELDADLMGSRALPTISAKTKVLPLTMKATGEAATVSFGTYWITARFVCSAKPHQKMDWRVELRFSEKGRPGASAIHTMSIGNLDMVSRTKPLVVDSYHFFDKPFVHTHAGQKASVTRLDYELRVVRL